MKFFSSPYTLLGWALNICAVGYGDTNVSNQLPLQSIAEIDKELTDKMFAPATLLACTSKRELSLQADFLYLKALEDSLDYAERIPQGNTFTPKVRSISQDFTYEPAFRIGAAYTFRPWEVSTVWTYYYTHPPTTHASNSHFGLLATLATPVWGTLSNSLVNDVKGSWTLKLNILDTLVRRSFCFRNFSIAPVTGLKLGFMEQRTHVHYQEFQIDYPDEVSPKDVKGKSSFWGLGPTLGVELGYLLSKSFKFFFNGYFSCLVGNFNTKTTYKDFDPQVTPPDSTILIRNSETKTSIVEQIQAGIDKKWTYKNYALEVALGWEIQVWENQMRLNYFSTFVSPPSGSDLSLYGPFFKARLSF